MSVNVQSVARDLPPEVWLVVFKWYMTINSVVYFDKLSEREQRQLYRLPWMHCHALQLLPVCKKWKDLALPLLYQHVCLLKQDSLSILESYLSESDSTGASLAPYVNSLYLHLNYGIHAGTGLHQVISLLERLPNLQNLMDVSDHFDNTGMITRHLPSLGQPIQVLSVTIPDAFSLSLLGVFQDLRHLNASLMHKGPENWCSRPCKSGITLPELRYLNIYLKNTNDERETQTNVWFLPFLADCSFPRLERVRANLMWTPSVDPRNYFRRFFENHPKLLDVNVPVFRNTHMHMFNSSFPITSATIRTDIWVTHMNWPDLLYALSPTVTRLVLPCLRPQQLEDLCQTLLKPEADHLRVREVQIYKFGESDLYPDDWGTPRLIASKIQGEERQILKTHSDSLYAHHKHRIRLLDSNEDFL